jgi:hypothetical protein
MHLPVDPCSIFIGETYYRAACRVKQRKTVAARGATVLPSWKPTIETTRSNLSPCRHRSPNPNRRILTLPLIQPYRFCCLEKTSLTSMVPKGRQWSLEEDAFIIAWIDYCLFHAKDYRATITGALHDTLDVQIEFESVRLQLYGLVRQYRKSGKTAKVPSLLKLGARYLRVKFPEELQKASDVLRREWKIDGEKFESKLLQTVTSEVRTFPAARSMFLIVSKSSTTQALSQRESPSGDADTCASPDFAGAETIEKLRPRAVHRNYVIEDSDSDDRDYDLPPLSDAMFQEHTRDESELPTPADTASGTKRPTVEPLSPAIISPDIFDDNSENADQMVLPRNGAKRVCYDTQSAVVEQTTTAISPRQVIAGPSGADSRTISPDAISGLETQQATLNNQPTGINQLAHFTTINDQLAQSSTTPLKLNHRWAILRRPLQLSASAVGNTIQPPSLYIARYLTDQSKRLLLASAQAQNASSWVHDLALPFFSPHAAQMVMSVVMMSSLFPGCEPLLNGGWRVAAKSLHAGGGSGTYRV